MFYIRKNILKFIFIKGEIYMLAMQQPVYYVEMAQSTIVTSNEQIYSSSENSDVIEKYENDIQKVEKCIQNIESAIKQTKKI